MRHICLFSGCDAERRGAEPHDGVVEVMSLGNGKLWGVQARGVGVGSSGKGRWSGSRLGRTQRSHGISGVQPKNRRKQSEEFKK